MSTSLLYHGFGLRAKGYVYQGTTYSGEGITFRVQRDPATLRCACCGSRDVIRSGAIQRRLRGLPIGHKPVWIQVAVPRLSCRTCGKTRQAAIGFAQMRVSYTQAFQRYALELGRHMTIQAVAEHLGVSWDVVKDIQKRHLRRRLRKIKLGKLKRLAIDEISIGKGHRYFTVVLDLDSGAVVFIGEGKGADALDPFWKKLRASRAKIQAVATDMSPAYTLAVHKHLPGAVHVFDRFHVVKLFNDKLSDLRRQVQNQAETIEQKKAIKGTRWLLLKNPDNLDPDKDEHQRLDEALRLNQPLAVAYYLKEDLRQLWEQGDHAAAAAFLDDWIARARASGVGILRKFANTLQLHRTGLLNWYRHPISTGPLEGTNNKIRTMQRQAYGYRDQEFFRLKIFALHEANYALVG
jgi:transposase